VVKKRLSDHMITRWDVVDSGDNPKSHVLLYKNEGGISGNKNVDSNGNKKKGEDRTMTLKEILAKMASEQSLTKEEQEFVKTESEAKDNEINTLKTESEAKDTKVDDIQKKFDNVEIELAEVKKETKPKDGDEEKKGEEAIKKASPEVQEEFKKMKERLEKSDKTAEAEAEKVGKLAEKIAKAEFVVKAKTMPGIGETPEKLADLLLSISKASPEEYPELEKVFETASKKIVEGTLLKAVGTDEEGDTGDAESKIKKAAEAMKKANPDLTDAQAEAEALEADPGLYEEYENAREGDK